jgi:integral membrane protein
MRQIAAPRGLKSFLLHLIFGPMAQHSITSYKTHVRLSGLLEGISFILLLAIAMPLKYWAGMPEYVRYIGMAHGVLFIWYIISVVLVRDQYRLSNRHTAVALLASLLPFGTFYADKKIFSHL